MALELEWPSWPGFSDGGDGQAAQLCLARQRPRAAQRRRARRLSLGGSGAADRGRSSSTRSNRPGGRSRGNASAPAEIAGRAAEAMPRRGTPPRRRATTRTSCADFRLAVAEYEKAILAAALEKCRWNQRAAAAALQPQLRPAPPRDEAPPAPGRLIDQRRPARRSRRPNGAARAILLWSSILQGRTRHAQ